MPDRPGSFQAVGEMDFVEFHRSDIPPFFAGGNIAKIPRINFADLNPCDFFPPERKCEHWPALVDRNAPNVSIAYRTNIVSVMVIASGEKRANSNRPWAAEAISEHILSINCASSREGRYSCTSILGSCECERFRREFVRFERHLCLRCVARPLCFDLERLERDLFRSVPRAESDAEGPLQEAGLFPFSAYCWRCDPLLLRGRFRSCLFWRSRER